MSCLFSKVLVVALGAVFTADAIAANSPNPVDAWLQAQTNLLSWSADFVQTRSFKALATPLTATGQVWFAAPNRFRWELMHPGHTIAVRAPKELLVIYPKLKRLERFPLDSKKAGQWRDALALLEAGFPRNRTQLDSQYQILAQSVADHTCRIALRPKSATAAKMMPRIEIVFNTESLMLNATELQFADGSSMRNEFKNARLNPPVDDELFAAPVPPDYKIVEPLRQR